MLNAQQVAHLLLIWYGNWPSSAPKCSSLRTRQFHKSHWKLPMLFTWFTSGQQNYDKHPKPQSISQFPLENSVTKAPIEGDLSWGISAYHEPPVAILPSSSIVRLVGPGQWPVGSEWRRGRTWRMKNLRTCKHIILGCPVGRKLVNSMVRINGL